MGLEITLLVLFSAVIHSIWNIQLKKSNAPITYVIAIAIVGWVIFKFSDSFFIFFISWKSLLKIRTFSCLSHSKRTFSFPDSCVRNINIK